MNFEILSLLALIFAPYLFIKYRVTSPFGYITFFLGVFFLGKYLHHEYLDAAYLMGLDGYQINAGFEALNFYLLIAFITYVLLSLAMSNFQFHCHKKESQNERGSFQLSAAASIMLICLPISLVFFGLTQNINPVENPLLFRQLIQGKGMFYLLSVQLFLTTIHAVYLPFYVISLKSRPAILESVAYAFALVFAIISGFASMISIFIVAPIFFYSICYRKKIELFFFSAIPITFAYTLVYSAYRDIRLNAGDIDIIEAFDKVFSNQDLTTVAYNRFDYLEMHALGREFISNTYHDYGLSMLNVIYQPIPRLIWPDKPDTFSTLMTKKLIPHNFDIGVTANFNSLNEFCYSFGSIGGVIVGGIFLGTLIYVIQRKFHSAKFKPYESLHYLSVLFPYLTGGFMVGFINDLPLALLILNSIFFKIFVKK